MRTNHICVLVSAVMSGACLGQSTSSGPMEPPVNGMRHTDPGWHAFTGATIHVSAGESIENGALVIKDGVIVQVRPIGGRNPVPPGAREHNSWGLHIYAGLIESFVEVDVAESEVEGPLLHWNAMVTPHHMAVLGAGLGDDERSSLVELGFVAANISPRTGIFRGHAGVVSLGEKPADDSLSQPGVYVSSSANVLSFDRATGTPDGRGYPVSHMGAVALIRQTLIDSDWQREAREAGESIEFNSLDAIMADVPLMFDIDNPRHVFSADGIGDEFGREVIIVGDGRAYQHLEAIAGEGRAMVVPLRFPARPDVSSVGMIEGLELKDLMAWEQAPTNAGRLIGAGLEVAITSSKVEGRGGFYKNLREAIEHGLGEDDALAALTTTPARLLGVEDRLGTLSVGKIASFIVADGPLFDEGTKILEVWIVGRRYEVSERKDESIAGRWAFTFGGDPGEDGVLSISFSDSGKVEVLGGGNGEDATQQKARNPRLDGNQLSYLFDMPDESGVVVASATFEDDRMFGTILVPSGETYAFTGVRLEGENAEVDEGAEDAEAEHEEDGGVDVPEGYGYPFGAYAVDEIPEAGAVLFVNATIWTSGPEGILHDAWVMIEDGKVQAIGSVGAPRGRPNMRIVDCEGKHITPGLIDAHSHTGIFAGGGNEGSQACTSEVRIHDNLDMGDINFYRQLAGGVTTVNTLHGSANPIGGQNAIHKVRWGSRHPDEMLLEGAMPGIKFALGENVKQSNWGGEYRVRYPQSRMGVETFIRDRFIAAKEYAEARDDGPRRRDLELDALAEILAGERLIHCHSYRQDEILMLCRVAGDFGFKIGSFQHVLEGYKVAEAIRENALGASCFSDWWAYKMEVQDAIPYNGPIMHAAGVVVSYNSDSDELSRRLNTEAAKAVKYGGIEASEALKFVTLNPAIQLGISEQVGSLEVGKDADLVIWSGDPLSSLSVCEATWIDGREYFSLELDAAHRERIASERRRILAKLLEDDKAEKKGDDDAGEDDGDSHDDPDWAMRDRLSVEFLDNLGVSVGDDRGDCGCTSDTWLHNLIHNR